MIEPKRKLFIDDRVIATRNIHQRRRIIREGTFGTIINFPHLWGSPPVYNVQWDGTPTNGDRWYCHNDDELGLYLPLKMPRSRLLRFY